MSEVSFSALFSLKCSFGTLGSMFRDLFSVFIMYWPVKILAVLRNPLPVMAAVFGLSFVLPSVLCFLMTGKRC